jgi:hypothetical protein
VRDWHLAEGFERRRERLLRKRRRRASPAPGGSL